jgi:hypothetical protein
MNATFNVKIHKYNNNTSRRSSKKNSVYANITAYNEYNMEVPDGNNTMNLEIVMSHYIG